ncbi:MAG: VanZ family protein [Actinobacteria bacterium]|jgi:VanZ like family.|nr:VanZ family protein [Actinomycetota bacterium]
MSRRTLLLLAVAVPYAVGVALLLVWPHGDQVREVQLAIWNFGKQHLGVPLSVGPDEYANLANALLVAPLTFVGVLLLTARRWWLVLLIGCAVGVLAEFLQAELGLSRVAQVSDALLNAAGAVIGLLVGVVVDRRVARAGDATPGSPTEAP